MCQSSNQARSFERPSCRPADLTLGKIKKPPLLPKPKRREGVFVLAVLDPFQTPVGPYNFSNDSSHLILLTLERRGHRIFYSDPSSLFVRRGRPMVRAARVAVLETGPYFTFGEEEACPLDRFPLILMRKDPPVDQAYLYATHLLSLVSNRVWVVNNPQALRDWNEKLIILNFPRLIPPTLVTADRQEISRFAPGGPIVVKPLAGFAGKGVRKITQGDPDFITVIEDMTQGGREPVMAQNYLPRISKGEKRVFMVAGAPLGALLKIPREGSFLANPDLGARLASTRLTTREKRICANLKPFLKKKGIFFAGIDLIDEKLIEINITSPGLVWEWNEVDNRRHEEEIVDLIEKRLKKKR